MYLLSGLVSCAICGYGCSGHANTSKGKRRSYYTCITNFRTRVPQRGEHGAPFIRGPSGWKRNLRVLLGQGHRPRCRGGRPLLLLCAHCADMGGGERGRGSRLQEVRR